MNLGKLDSVSDGKEVCLKVFVEAVREYEAGQGVMGFVLLKDSYAEVDMVVFAKKYAECKEILHLDKPIWVIAQVDKKSDEEHSLSLIAKEISRVKPSNYSG